MERRSGYRCSHCLAAEHLSELTGLRVSDVVPNELIGAVAIYINEDRKAGRRLKTKQSERFVPVHPQLHSFRHSYIDALRVANVGDEIKHALLGWSGGGIPARYGAKDKAARFRHRLAEAAANVDYTGLDLSNVEYRT